MRKEGRPKGVRMFGVFVVTDVAIELNLSSCQTLLYFGFKNTYPKIRENFSLFVNCILQKGKKRVENQPKNRVFSEARNLEFYLKSIACLSINPIWNSEYRCANILTE
jgi:hypothetical protein